MPAAEAGTIASASVDQGIESSSDESLDDSYQVFKATEDLQVDPAEAKRVLRKIDLRVVPVLFFTYMLQYLDKSEFRGGCEEFHLRGILPFENCADILFLPTDSLNFASVYGLKQGTNLHGQDYSWLGLSPSPADRYIAVHTDTHPPNRINLLLRLPRRAVPVVVRPPGPPDRQVCQRHHGALGRDPDDDAGVHVVRGHRDEPVPAGVLRGGHQPGVRDHHEHL